jgi:hypothetical protein
MINNDGWLEGVPRQAFHTLYFFNRDSSMFSTKDWTVSPSLSDVFQLVSFNGLGFAVVTAASHLALVGPLFS